MAKEEVFFGINIDTGEAIKDFGTLKRRTKELKKELDGTKVGTKRFKELQTEITRNQGTIRRFNRELRQTKSLATRVGQGVTTAFKRVGVAMAGAFAVSGIFQLIKNGIKTFAAFEQKIADVGAVSGATATELKKLELSARGLGKSSIFTAEQVAGLQLELAKLGFTTEEIISASGGILDLSTAFRIDLSQAASVTASTLRAFGLDANDTTMLTDLMADSFSSTALDIDKFQESVKLVAPAAKLTGVAVDEVSALLGVLANNGLSGSVAGTQLNRVFIELNEKGLTLEDAMIRVNNATNPFAESLELVGDRGGKALAIFATQQDSLKALRKDFADVTGEANKLSKASGDTLIGATRRLQSAYDEFILSLSETDSFMARITRGAVELGTSFLELITDSEDLSESMQKQRIELNVLISRITDANIKEKDRIDLIQQLNKEYPEFLGNLNAETATNQQLAMRLGEVNKEMINKIALQLQDEKLQIKLKKAAELQNEIFEEEGKIRARIIELNEDYNLGISTTGVSLVQMTRAAQSALDAQTVITDNFKTGLPTVNAQGRANSKLSNSLVFLKGVQEDYNEAQQEAIDLQKQRQRLVESLFAGEDPTAPVTSDTSTSTTTGDSKATKKTAEELETQRNLYFENERLKIMILKQGEEEELALLSLKYEKENQNFLNAGLTQVQITEALERDKEEVKQKYRDKEAKAEAKKQRELKKFRDAQAKYDEEQLKKKEDALKAKLEMDTVALESTQQLIGSSISLLARDEAARQKNGKLIKALAIAEIAINTQKALMNVEVNEKSPLFLPNLFTGGLAGLTIGTVQKIAIAAQGIASAGIVASQKFAKGGILSGPSHAQGGIKTNLGELEGGEAVINKKSTAMFGGALSAINEAGGGKKFAKGGVLGVPSTVNTPDTTNSQVLRAINNINIKPTVSVVEINDAQTRISEIQNNSTL